MKNSNVVWVADAIKPIRKWLERRLPPRTPKHEIDDLAQKVCLIAVTKLGQIPEDLGEARVKAWLRRTCELVAMKHKYNLSVAIRRGGGTEFVEIELPPQRRPPTEDAFVTALCKVWQCLNQQQRVVLRMWMEGKSRHEIANALGVSVATVFKRRKEIIAVLKEQYEETLFGIIPPGIVRTQQAHTVAWTVGVMATVVLILWLTGRGEDADTGAQPAVAIVESPEEEADVDLHGRGRRRPEPTAPPVPSTVTVTTLAVDEAPGVRVDADDTTPEGAPVSKRTPQHPGHSRPGFKPRRPRPTNTADDAPSVQAPETPSLVQQETDIIDQARAAYSRRDYATALTHLDEHAQRFPNGTMATDREKLRVPVLCALDRAEDAAMVERVLKTYHDPGPLRCDIPRRPK